jgi:four helix bundle protein
MLSEVDSERRGIASYRDLRVWQDAMVLAVACFRLTREFPREEMFGMSSQIRRSASSIAANIAEGYGRDQSRPFVQFLRVAQGSLKELETHLLLVERVELALGSTGRAASLQLRGRRKNVAVSDSFVAEAPGRGLVMVTVRFTTHQALLTKPATCACGGS